jgi:4'-phosphopantetheinyl transferase
MGDDVSVSVRLYTAVLDRVDDAGARACCEALLSSEERAFRDQLVFEGSRREYLYAHALTRIALTHNSPDVEPRAWEFSKGAHGRPAIAGPSAVPALHFNLSHTTGMVACVVSNYPLVGVDVEAMEHSRTKVELAQSFFSPIEARALRLVPLDQQRDWFLRYWTLKESYIKARGLGLTLPLDQFWFVPSGRGGMEIEVASAIDDGASWRFAERRPTPQHWLAVAVGRQRREAWNIELVERVVGRTSFFSASIDDSPL